MTFRRLARHSLKARITVAMLAIFVISIWSLSFYTSQILKDDMKSLLGEQQFSSTMLVAKEIDEKLSDRLAAMALMAEKVDPRLMANPAALQAWLEQHPILDLLFNGGIFVTGADGVSLASVPLSIESVSRIGVSHMTGDFMITALREGKPSIGKPVMGKLFQSPVFLMAVPILDDQGAVVGALVGVTNLGQANFLDNITQSRYGSSGGYLLVAPQHELFVTATDTSRIMQPVPAPGLNAMLDRYMQGHEGYGVAISSRGVEELTAAKAIPVADWFLVTVLPTEEAFAPIRDMQQRMLWTTILLTLLAGGLIWWMLRRELAPMLATVKTLAALSESNQSPQPLPITRQDEIGELIGGFNLLLETLRTREHALLLNQNMLARTEGIAHVGSWEWDVVTDTVNWSDELFRIFQRNPADGAPSFSEHSSLYFPEDLERLKAAVDATLNQGTPYELELRAIRQDGAARVCVVRGYAEMDVDKRVTGLFGSFQDITERKQAEEAIVHSHELMRYVIEHNNSAIAIHDKSLKYIYVSQRYLHDFNVKEKDVIGKHHYEVFPDLPQKWRDVHQKALSGVISRADDDSFPKEDGTLEWTRWECRPWYEANGSIGGIIIYSEVITERKQAEVKLQLAANVFAHAGEGIIITDTQGTIVDVNAAFTRITGYSRGQAIGQNSRILKSGRQDKAFYETMWRDLTEEGHWSGEIWNRRKNGEVYAELLTISALRDANGNVQQYVGLSSDITAIKTHQIQLEQIAHFDALTSLPNRVLLADRLHQAMVQARRRGRVLAVAFLDLDGFKAINDNHGHKVGDSLLIAVSARMKGSLREGDTLARIGGDEFVAVLVDLSGSEDCEPTLSRLLAAVAEPVPVGELTLHVSASLGVTFYPQEEDIEADQLQRQADQAMYQAKLAGKNRYHVFDAAQDRNLRGQHESIERIRRALAEHEFTLHYQPKVNMRSGAVVGAEALIRWQHPQKGLLAPAAFLPVIEDHPLAIEIGEWVIESALTQIEAWHAAALELPVSVNVGSRQLQQPDFVKRLQARLMAHPAIRPNDLEIEVLETSALEDITRVSMVIEACRKLGVTFALDDFGTGYSSLTYLKRLAVTMLKIDQSFVRDMLEDPDDLTILEGVIGLATAFRRTAIAEGVESMEHGEMLLQMGCDLAQGYGIAHPMPADEIPGWWAAWRSPPAWANYQQVRHDNLPLLHAAVEHRAWIMAAEHYIKGERAAPPPLDPHHCRFGLWLDAERQSGRDTHPGLIAIETLHQQVHTLVDELCKLRTDGRDTESVARLDELYSLRDALLGQMKTLETSRWRSTADL